MVSYVDVFDRGMSALISALGVVDTEYFITYLKQERFDYTKWRQDQFDDMSITEISIAAAEYEKEHPISSTAIRI